MTNNMPERISAYLNWMGLGCFEFHPNIPLTTEYIRADVAAAQLAERDARIAELEAALIQIKEHKCETYTTGDCLAHVGRYIGSPYTFNAICDTCVANYALRGEFEKLPRWTPDVVNAV